MISDAKATAARKTRRVKFRAGRVVQAQRLRKYLRTKGIELPSTMMGSLDALADRFFPKGKSERKGKCSGKGKHATSSISSSSKGKDKGDVDTNNCPTTCDCACHLPLKLYMINHDPPPDLRTFNCICVHCGPVAPNGSRRCRFNVCVSLVIKNAS